MNILMVCENFSGGGLETHIHSYYSELKKEHNFVFALGSFKSRLIFNPNDIVTAFNFSWESSVYEFIQDVKRLVDLIHERNIDVIHVHPFFSLFPAAVASQLTGVPIVCTYHGIASFSFTNRINDTILFQYIYMELMSKIFTVSNIGKDSLMDRLHVKNVVFLPNAVDTRVYRKHQIISNRRWAAISRLDGDNGKEIALKKLFDLLPSLDINEIDIYGDGTRRNALEKYVKEIGLENKVKFLGFQTDLYERLDGKYNGIIGTDRVAIEGLVMGYPVLELGYGHLCGIFDEKLLKLAWNCNFDANILPENGSHETLNQQLKHVYEEPMHFDFRNKMVETFDIHKIALRYIKEIQELEFYPHANVQDWFYALEQLNEQNENMYRSQKVFGLMKTYIEYYAVMPNIKLLFLLGGECYDLRNTIAWVQDHGNTNVSKEGSILKRVYKKFKKHL